MTKLHQLLNLKEPIKGEVGIEVECEGKNLQIMDDKYWKTEDDGSLRGHFPDERSEYVLKKPIVRQDVSKAILSLSKGQEAATLNFSFRTSVHIHINCQELNNDEIISVIYTYLILEELLIKYCGESRKANRFCLRLKDAEQQLDPIKWIISSGIRAVKEIDPDGYRYAAINLAPLNTYGSLEFRAMEGTLDVERLTSWTSALLCVKDYAVKSGNPLKIYRDFVKHGAYGFLTQVLSEDLLDKFWYKGAEQDMLNSASLTIEIPFEWEKVSKLEKKGNEYQAAIPVIPKWGGVFNPAPGLIPPRRKADMAAQAAQMQIAVDLAREQRNQDNLARDLGLAFPDEPQPEIQDDVNF